MFVLKLIIAQYLGFSLKIIITVVFLGIFIQPAGIKKHLRLHIITYVFCFLLTLKLVSMLLELGNACGCYLGRKIMV